MLTAEEIRAQQLKRLEAILARPVLWSVCGPDYEIAIRSQIGELSVIDEQGAEGGRWLDGLLRYHGESGVAGAFSAVFGLQGTQRNPYFDCEFLEEIGSVYARAMLHLGYLELERRLADTEWTTLREAVTEYDSKDCRRSDIVSRFGEPSLAVGERVLCYVAQASDDAWVYFDCFENQAPAAYDIEKGGLAHNPWVKDPLLRDVRAPAANFADSFVLTAWGKLVRWGPGWWIDHPRPDLDAKSAAIAAQLRRIAENDPSQSLGPRRR
jgi:hypothetical protein